MHQPRFPLPLVLHASIRQNQRGVLTDALGLLHAAADREALQQDGRILRWLSADRLAELRAEGVERALLERLIDVFLVESADGMILTILNHRRRGAERRKAARSRCARARIREAGRRWR